MTILTIALFVIFSTLNILLLFNLGITAIIKALLAGAVQAIIVSLIIFIIVVIIRKIFRR